MASKSCSGETVGNRITTSVAVSAVIVTRPSAPAAGAPRAVSTAAPNEKTTSSAVTGVPSAQVAPLRRVNRQLRESIRCHRSANGYGENEDVGEDNLNAAMTCHAF